MSCIAACCVVRWGKHGWNEEEKCLHLISLTPNEIETFIHKKRLQVGRNTDNKIQNKEHSYEMFWENDAKKKNISAMYFFLSFQIVPTRPQTSF